MLQHPKKFLVAREPRNEYIVERTSSFVNRRKHVYHALFRPFCHATGRSLRTLLCVFETRHSVDSRTGWKIKSKNAKIKTSKIQPSFLKCPIIKNKCGVLRLPNRRVDRPCPASFYSEEHLVRKARRPFARFAYRHRLHAGFIRTR